MVIERTKKQAAMDVYDIIQRDVFCKIAYGYFDDEREILYQRILPLLEIKLQNSKEKYFDNTYEVWN